MVLKNGTLALISVLRQELQCELQLAVQLLEHGIPLVMEHLSELIAVMVVNGFTVTCKELEIGDKEVLSVPAKSWVKLAINQGQITYTLKLKMVTLTEELMAQVPTKI